MCATLTAPRPWPARSAVVGGIAAGVTGTALFIVIHSLLIVPIWTRFLGHLPISIAAGIGLALAFDEYVRLEPDATTVFGRGWRFGLITFATLAPATAFSNALRATGVAGGPNGTFGFAGTVALAAASGALAGRLVTRRRRGVFTFAASTLALTIAMGGTIPVVNSARATLLFTGFLPICVGAGIALTLVHRCLTSAERP